jgi:hypothetical protein
MKSDRLKAALSYAERHCAMFMEYGEKNVGQRTINPANKRSRMTQQTKLAGVALVAG